ncbi:hypothetical protein ACFL5K_03945 [Gemmatimonadota bacterium]
MEKNYQDVLDRLPGVAGIVRECGGLSLEEYAGSLYRHEKQSIQPREDLIEVVGRYARRLLGDKTAALLENHFADTPVALTANHHGVDYSALTVQGTIIFSLPRLLAGSPEIIPVVPVLAFGIVPLNNFSFPRGIALSRAIMSAGQSAEKDKTQVKIPVIPVKNAQTLVSAAGPVTREMVLRSLKKVEKLAGEGTILESEESSLSALLSEEYLRDEILCLTDYSDQAVALNSVVWNRMFAACLRDELPELAYLEIERVVAALLEKDLHDDTSLLHNLLFDPLLREELLHSLDKKFGCWNISQLEKLSSPGAQGTPSYESYRGCGTAFFWQVDHKGRRMPLALKTDGPRPYLSGVPPGTGDRVPLTPESLVHGLKERKLFPGLFTSFATLAFARGIKCIGGFKQVDYLQDMQQGLLKALETQGHNDWTNKIAGMSTANFVTGMNIALAHYPDGQMSSAGAIGIIASGGLTRSDIERIKTLTVEEANLAGLLVTYPEFCGGDRPEEGWFSSLKAYVMDRSGEKLVHIRL